MDNIKRLNAITLQVVFASIICTIYTFVDPMAGFERAFYPLMLLFTAPFYVILNELFLKRERSIRATILFNFLLVFITDIAIILADIGSFSFTKTVATPLLILIFFALFSVRLVTKPAKNKTALHTFDVSMVFFLITIFTLSRHSYPISFSYASLSGLSLSFFSLIVSKQKSSGTNRNWLSTGICAFIAIALMYLMAQYSYFAGEGLVQIWNSLISFMESIMLFIKYLISKIPTIFPKPNENLIPVLVDDTFKGQVVINDEVNPVIFVVIVIAVAIIAELILLLYFLRSSKLNAKKRTRNREVISYSNTSLWDGIKNTFRRLKQIIDAKIYISKNKDKSIGLYFWIINALKKDIWRKRVSETPRDFLIRIETNLQKEDMDITLHPMIDSVERFFYSNGKKEAIHYENAKTIRKEIKKIVLIRRYRDFIADAKESFKRLIDRDKFIKAQKKNQI